VNRPTERLYVVNSGLARLQAGHQDLYQPGTQMERAYMQSLSSVYQVDSIIDPTTAASQLIEGAIIEGIELDNSGT
jgi:hypothetical protein